MGGLAGVSPFWIVLYGGNVRTLGLLCYWGLAKALAVLAPGRFLPFNGAWKRGLGFTCEHAVPPNLRTSRTSTQPKA